MAEKEIVGDQKTMPTRPVSSPSSNPRQGEVQLVGDASKLNRTPVQSPSANPKQGEVQLVGDQQKLNRTPVKGWGSAASIPMSERSIQQSKTKA